MSTVSALQSTISCVEERTRQCRKRKRRCGVTHLVLRVFVDGPRAHARLVALLKRLVHTLFGAKGVRAARNKRCQRDEPHLQDAAIPLAVHKRRHAVQVVVVERVSQADAAGRGARSASLICFKLALVIQLFKVRQKGLC